MAVAAWVAAVLPSVAVAWVVVPLASVAASWAAGAAVALQAAERQAEPLLEGLSSVVVKPFAEGLCHWATAMVSAVAVDAQE